MEPEQTVHPTVLLYYLNRIQKFLKSDKKLQIFPSISKELEEILVKVTQDVDTLKEIGLDAEVTDAATKISDVLKTNKAVYRLIHEYETGEYGKNVLAYKKCYIKPKIAPLRKPSKYILGSDGFKIESSVTSQFKLCCLNAALKFVKDDTQLVFKFPDMASTQADFVMTMLSQGQNSSTTDQTDIGFGYKSLYSPLWEAMKIFSLKYDYRIEYVKPDNPDMKKILFEKVPKRQHSKRMDETANIFSSSCNLSARLITQTTLSSSNLTFAVKNLNSNDITNYPVPARISAKTCTAAFCANNSNTITTTTASTKNLTTTTNNSTTTTTNSTTILSNTTTTTTNSTTILSNTATTTSISTATASKTSTFNSSSTNKTITNTNNPTTNTKRQTLLSTETTNNIPPPTTPNNKISAIKPTMPASISRFIVNMRTSMEKVPDSFINESLEKIKDFVSKKEEASIIFKDVDQHHKEFLKNVRKISQNSKCYMLFSAENQERLDSIKHFLMAKGDYSIHEVPASNKDTKRKNISLMKKATFKHNIQEKMNPEGDLNEKENINGNANTVLQVSEEISTPYETKMTSKTGQLGSKRKKAMRKTINSLDKAFVSTHIEKLHHFISKERELIIEKLTDDQMTFLKSLHLVCNKRMASDLFETEARLRLMEIRKLLEVQEYLIEVRKYFDVESCKNMWKIRFTQNLLEVDTPKEIPPKRPPSPAATRRSRSMDPPSKPEPLVFRTNLQQKLNQKTIMEKVKEALAQPVQSDKAMKMMKMMGWKGEGLGAREDGILEPVMPALDLARRAGLGHEPERPKTKENVKSLPNKGLSNRDKLEIRTMGLKSILNFVTSDADEAKLLYLPPAVLTKKEYNFLVEYVRLFNNRKLMQLSNSVLQDLASSIHTQSTKYIGLKLNIYILDKETVALTKKYHKHNAQTQFEDTKDTKPKCQVEVPKPKAKLFRPFILSEIQGFAKSNDVKRVVNLQEDINVNVAKGIKGLLGKLNNKAYLNGTAAEVECYDSIVTEMAAKSFKKNLLCIMSNVVHIAKIFSNDRNNNEISSKEIHSTNVEENTQSDIPKSKTTTKSERNKSVAENGPENLGQKDKDTADDINPKTSNDRVNNKKEPTKVNKTVGKSVVKNAGDDNYKTLNDLQIEKQTVSQIKAYSKILIDTIEKHAQDHIERLKVKSGHVDNIVDSSNNNTEENSVVAIQRGKTVMEANNEKDHNKYNSNNIKVETVTDIHGKDQYGADNEKSNGNDTADKDVKIENKKGESMVAKNISEENCQKKRRIIKERNLESFAREVILGKRAHSPNRQETLKKFKFIDFKTLYVLPRDYPKNKIDNEKAREIQTSIYRAIDYTKETLPLLTCHGIQNGRLVYSCQNEKSVFFMEDLMTTMQDLKIEYEIDNTQTNCIKLSFIIFTSIEEDTNKILQQLELCNSSLDVSKWVVIKKKQNNDSLEVFVEIDDLSYEYVRDAKFDLQFGKDRALFYM